MFLDSNCLLIFVRDSESWYYSLCAFLQPSVAASLFGPNRSSRSKFDAASLSKLFLMNREIFKINAMFYRNVGKDLICDAASHPKRPECLITPLWRFQTLHPNILSSTQLQHTCNLFSVFNVTDRFDAHIKNTHKYSSVFPFLIQLNCLFQKGNIWHFLDVCVPSIIVLCRPSLFSLRWGRYTRCDIYKQSRDPTAQF